MGQQQINLYNTSLDKLFDRVKERYPSVDYIYSRHMVSWEDTSQNLVGAVRLPLHMSIDEQLRVASDDSITDEQCKHRSQTAHRLPQADRSTSSNLHNC